MDNLIQQFISYITHEKRMSPKTVLAYSTDLTQFKEYLTNFFKELNVQEIDHQIIRNWIVILKENELTNRSINRKLSTLKTFFNYLRKVDCITHNPMAKITSPKVQKKLPVYFTHQSLDKLFVYFDQQEKTFKILRDQLIMELLYGTGMRLSELINLKGSDISSNQIKVLGKRNKERLVTVTPRINKTLQAFQNIVEVKSSKCDFLLLTDNGNKLYPKFVYRIVNHYIRLISNEKKRSPHTLRHSFATNMLNEGAKLHVIKEALGHANLNATEIYTHNSISRLKEAYKKFHPKENNSNKLK